MKKGQIFMKHRVCCNMPYAANESTDQLWYIDVSALGTHSWNGL